MKIKGPNNSVWVSNCMDGEYNPQTGEVKQEGYLTLNVGKGLITDRPVSPVGGYSFKELEDWGFVGLYEPAKK